MSDVEGAVGNVFPILDWAELWADDSTEEWILEPILPARRLVSLYSPPKTGKSLLMLELAAAVSSGREVLGVTPDRPRRVLYVDFENDPKEDVRTRLQAMGYVPADLGSLCYLSYPNMAALDSERGSLELMAAIDHYDCEVVIIDTVSRAVRGEENENDTWLNFYRHTGLKLKQAGVSCIRLDHTGKDESRGQRGGSAKSADVDAVWRLSAVVKGETYRLECEMNRMPIAEQELVLRRISDPFLRHKVEGAGRLAAFDAKVAEIVRTLDAMDSPLDAGRDAIRKTLKSRGITASNNPLTEAIKQRKARHGYAQTTAL